MRNHKKEDKLFVSDINSQNDMKTVSKEPSGNAGTDPFCIYGNKRHAVGSKINNHDGSETVCTDKGWQRDP